MPKDLRSKVAIVSHLLPPAPSGQSVLIYRLFRDLDPDDYCSISNHDDPHDSGQGTDAGKLSGKCFRLGPDINFTKGGRFQSLNRKRPEINLWLNVLARGRQIARIIKRERCDALVACTADLLNLPAAFVATRFAGISFYPFILDDYSYQWIDPLARSFAQKVEAFFLKGAAEIIVLNQFMSDELHQRYGVTAKIVHHPCELADYQTAPGFREKADAEIKIVFTGAVYEANYDAFRDLLTGLALLGDQNLRLHIYSSQPPDALADKDHAQKIVWHAHEPPSEMPRIQCGSDLLFLPLAFQSPYPEVIRTAAPTKMGEYLASGRPILVHAPSDSYICWYFRKYDCGVVIDRDEPDAVAKAIRTVLDDAELRNRVSQNARARAAADFSITVARTRFFQALNRV